MMRILLTNDDGIDAAGLHALYRAVADMGEVCVVAPATVQSATSHAVTLDRPIEVTPYKCDLFEGFSVAGRPADCVKLAARQLVKQPIDLVLSGINHGANVGVNVHYSGTVGAAREGAFLGLPSIALSLHIGDWSLDHWDRAGAYAREAIDAVLAAGALERRGALLNINVPILDGGAEPRGIRVVPLNIAPMLDHYVTEPGDAGAVRYKIQDSMAFSDRGQGTDVDTLYDRYITVTPLHFEQTDRGALAKLGRELG